MNVGSLFSGIGGLDLGLARAGFRHAFFCESDAWRRSVLAHHWPGVPVYEDVRAVGESEGRAAADGRGASVDIGRWEAGAGLLCGGFPCQDVSVAGRRAGLAGARSGLFHEFARIAESLRPRWLLVENVPGLLSSNGGRDFGVVLGTLADIGYGVAWRIVDSRFFGVPQRRRRVFVLGALAESDTRAAAERAGEILAVGTRCSGHPATGAEARENAAVASLSGLGSGGPDDNDAQQGRVVTHALTSQGADASEDGTGRGTPMVASTLGTRTRHAHGDGETMIAAPLSHGSNPNHEPDDLAYLTRKLKRSIASEATGVRRLTPTECERLQALPDGWTDFGPDSRRYAALGDAVTASVAEWIGRRLLAA